MRVPYFEPMLASAGPPPTGLAAHAAEIKSDGWRAQVGCADGAVTVRSRGGHPLVVPSLDALAGRELVLDGELVSAAGRAVDFYDVVRNLGRRGDATELRFVAFDVLWADGVTLIDQPYEQRRHTLENLDLGGAVSVVRSWPGTDLPDLMDACEEHGVEGVVLKHLGSRYRPGARSRLWRKVKCQSWLDEHARRRGPDHWHRRRHTPSLSS